MTRINSAKLVMLVALLLLHALLMATNRWVGTSGSVEKRPQINFIGSTKSEGFIEINLSGFILEEKTIDGQLVSIPKLTGGHPLLDKGSPDIQKTSFILELPSKGNLDISVVSSEYTEYTDLQIPPSVGNKSRSESVTNPEKGAQYNSNSFYPGKLFEQEFPHIVRNTRAQSIHVYPLQYNAVTKTLRVYTHLTLRFVKNSELGDNELTEADLRVSQVQSFAQTCINNENDVLKTGKLPSALGRMIIICPAQFEKAIEPLANWRNQTGIRTEIVDAANFQNPDQIIAFVKESYYSYGDLSYLLLVGDAELVPTYMLPYGASDNYYSYLAGNDHYPDILVGRFSAETSEDVEIQVKRTIEYEMEPKNGGSWIPSATGIASSLACGDDLESDVQHIRNLLSNLQSGSYTSINEFFEGSNGGADADGNPTTEMVTSKIKEGTGVIFYSGHGSPNSWATGAISKSVVDFLDNSTKYPLIWSVACEAGNFKGQRCLAEAWLRAGTSSKPSGAVAALMASGNQTTFPPMEAQDKIAQVLSTAADEIITMGAITVMGLMSMNDAYGSVGYPMTDTWILFGDPALMIRTSTPQKIIANMPGSIGEGRLYYKVKSNTSSGVVCLSQDSKIQGFSTIDRGISNITLDFPASGSSLNATITAMNYIPLQKSISISALPGEPEYLSPINYSKLQPIKNTLNWDANDGASSDYFLISIGTDNPPSNLLKDIKVVNTTFELPMILEYSTNYYWQIISVNKNGTKPGLVNQFTTVYKPDEDFEPEFKQKQLWANGGSTEWVLDTEYHFDGQKALRSGDVEDNQYSSILFPCEVKGCDFVSFWCKTSSDINDKLMFLIDNVLIDEWSGEMDWQYHIFSVSTGNHLLEWRYQKNPNSKSGLDAAWLDDIHLPVHEAMFAELEPIAQACEGTFFNTTARADNYFNLVWSSNGDGEFIENGLANSIYKPGPRDIEEGNIALTLNVNGVEGCSAIVGSTVLTINPLPIIALPSDTIIINNSIELNAAVEGNNSYTWLPDNISGSLIAVDSSMAENSKKVLLLQVTSDKGCVAEKEIRIHFNNSSIADEYTIFPNPSDGKFSLNPVKGSAVLEAMELFDCNGRCVWKRSEPKNVFHSADVAIEGLNPGVYHLITKSSSGNATNKVVIQ